MGLFTNFKNWIFTRYDMMEEIVSEDKKFENIFEFSETFEILSIK